MNAAFEWLFEHNPFSTEKVRPGAIPYQFPSGTTATDVIVRLREHDWWGQIVGPHGSGKSTLLQTLIPALEEAGRSVREFTMHQGESRLAVNGKDIQSWPENTLVVVDGYEQLGSWSRTLLLRILKRQQLGLLATTHEDAGLPTLLNINPSLELVQQLVEGLLHSVDGPEGIISADDVRTSYERQAGNVREVFFELYDVFERHNTE